MATYLKDLIDKLNSEDIPTNIFTIEDEDPNVLLGKMNEVVSKLQDIRDNIDSKVEKKSATGVPFIYGANEKGVTQAYQFTSGANAYSMMRRDSRGATQVADPQYETDAVNKRTATKMTKELDDKITNLVNFNGVSNPNLLINADFRVNQRGQTTYSNINVFCVDRWKLQDTELIYDVATKTLTNTKTNGWCYMFQKIEDSAVLKGKTVTISAKVDGVIYSKTVEIPTTLTNGALEYLNIDKGNIFLQVYSNSIIGFVFGLKPNQSEIIEWAKLEIGSVATAFSPRPYAEELAMCQRYYMRYNTSSTYGTLTDCITANSTIQVRATLDLPVEMRVSPTVKLNGVMQVVGASGNMAVSGLGTTIKTGNREILIIQVSGTLVAWSNYFIQANNDATASIVLDAEIY